MILELESAFLIYVKIVDLRVTFSQPPLNVCHSLIAAPSCNDFPSQHWGEGHIILSHDRRYLNARFFPGDAESRQVVTVSFAAQGIRNHILFTRVIVNLKIIVLDQLQPSSLSHVQIRLSEKVLQALMVGEDMSHIPPKIMPLRMQSMNHSGQLKIMQIVLFMRVQLTWGIHNYVTFLHENTAKPSTRCITVNNEGLCDVWLCQHRRCSQQLPKGLERFITLCIPDKFLLFLQKISDGLGNLGEVQNKSVIVASQAKKTADLMHSSWRLPIQYFSNLARIHGYSF
jgi:hypothetical protein